MYGTLGKDQSDVNTLTVIVRRLAKNPSLGVRHKSFDGGGNMFNDGRRVLQALSSLNCNRLIICHDADGPVPSTNYHRVRERIVEPAGLEDSSLVLIPVQELEAWLVADIETMTRIFKSWKPKPISNPEGIRNPKEHLIRLSRDSRHRPRYSHATHNEQVARYLDLDKVKRKCPSFRPLVTFITSP